MTSPNATEIAPDPGFDALPYAQKVTYLIIKQAAEDGAPCPMNKDIAETTGHSSVSSATELVQALELKGLITVERFRKFRVVTIVASGKRTAPKPARKHNPYIAQRRRRLPLMIEAAERKLIGLHREARRYGMDDLIADRPVMVDAA